jgi:O-antigen/teichoic acid export membrane protein
MTDQPTQGTPTPEHPASEDHPVLQRLKLDVSLGAAARSGGLWLILSSVGAQASQFFVSILMAHLLLPSQFGETALVYSLAGFAVLFTDLGLGAAVVHARHVTEELLATAFWLNAVTGLALTFLVAGLALPIANLYSQPQLTGLLVLASFNFVLSLGTVQLALLERTFNFRKIAVIETVSAVVGYIVMPIAVLLGCGVYSLVIGPLVTTVLTSAWLWRAARWTPSLRTTRTALRQLWGFSRALVGFNAVNYWARNLDNVLLGATVSRSALGDYNRAYNLMMIPVAQVGGVFMRGMYPVLARMRDDPARMGRAYLRATATGVGAFSFPITFTFAATAPAMISVLYGNAWKGAIPLLELLSLAAVPQILGSSVGGPCRAAGRNDILFKLSIAGTVATVFAIVMGLPWGASGVATAILIRSWIWLPITMSPLARIFMMPLHRVMWPLIISALPALCMGVAELAVRLTLSGQTAAWEVFLLQLTAGGIIFFFSMWRSDSEAAQLMRRRAAVVWRTVRRPVTLDV